MAVTLLRGRAMEMAGMIPRNRVRNGRLAEKQLCWFSIRETILAGISGKAMNGFFLAFLLLTIVALLVLVRWAAEDAIQRGKSPWLVSLAVIFFFPWGLIAWLIFRPELPNRPRFRLEDYRK